MRSNEARSVMNSLIEVAGQWLVNIGPQRAVAGERLRETERGWRDRDFTNLCSNQKFRRCARENLILQLIVRDRDCADTIASCLEDFQNCDADALIEAFMSSADPERRWLLVRNSSLSAKLRKQLAMDPDPSVAAEAKRRLRTERC